MQDIKQLDMIEVGKMDIEGIETLRTEKQTQLYEISTNYGVVEQEYLNIQKNIIELQLKKKEMELRMSKGKQILRQLNLQVKMLENMFWRKKN